LHQFLEIIREQNAPRVSIIIKVGVGRNWNSCLGLLSGTIKSVALAFGPDHVAENRDAYGVAQTRESIVHEQLEDLTMLNGAISKVRPEIVS